MRHAVPSLNWLATQSPIVIAPSATISDVKCQFYVPDNSADLIVPAWSRGDVNKQVRRTEKIVRPTHLAADTLHYLFPFPADRSHFDTLRGAARSITHLGWGVDMVAGDVSELAADDVAKLPGEVWRPVDDGAGTPLRVPIAGTLDALVAKHEAFLHRLGPDGFRPVPPLTAFRVVHYRRAADPVARPIAAFSILKPDATGNRAFDAVRRCRDVAAWIRAAVSKACAGWPFGDIGKFVHGHDDDGKPLKGPQANDRFMYLPLPSIERRGERGNHVGAIRRVIVVAPPQFRERVDWIRRRLSGQDLIAPDQEVMGLLTILPASDWVLRQYTAAPKGACAWSTVTPVIWPGHDDRDPRKAEAILRKAFVQAGLAPELVAQIGERDLDWRPVGFRAGLDLASRYLPPDRVNGRMYHVRVRFPLPILGPIAIGAGRYRGFGLFAAED